MRERWVHSLSLVGFFVLWQFVAQVLENPTLPTPTAVLVSLWYQLVA